METSIKRILCLLSASVFWCLPVQAQSDINYSIAHWSTDLSAGGRYVSSAWTGLVDAKRDLGIGDSSSSLQKMQFKLSDRSIITITHFNTEYRGEFTKTIRQEFWGGLISREITNHAKERVGLTLSGLDWYRFKPTTPETKDRQAFVVGIRRAASSGDAVLQSSTPETLPVITKGSYTWSSYIPIVGYHVEGLLASLAYSMDVVGFSTGANGIHYAEFHVKIVLSQPQKIESFIGYRGCFYRNSRSADNSIIRTVAVKGPYFGATYHF